MEYISFEFSDFIWPFALPAVPREQGMPAEDRHGWTLREGNLFHTRADSARHLVNDCLVQVSRFRAVQGAPIAGRSGRGSAYPNATTATSR